MPRTVRAVPRWALEAAAQRKHQVEDRSALDVVLGRFLVVRHLLACGCEVGAACWGLRVSHAALRLCGRAGSLRLATGNGRRTPTPRAQHAASRVCRESRLLNSCCTAKDQPLLGRRDALLLLDSLLDARDRVVALDIDLDLLASQRFHLDLPAASTWCQWRGLANTRVCLLGFAARHARSWLEQAAERSAAVLSQRACTGEAHLSGSTLFMSSGRHPALPRSGMGGRSVPTRSASRSWPWSPAGAPRGRACGSRERGGERLRARGRGSDARD